MRRIKDLKHFPLMEALLKTYAKLTSYQFHMVEAKLFSGFMMPMLSIYPERRAKAQDMLRHPWISHPTRNKDHVCTDPELAQANLEAFQAKMKSADPFYRELKVFDEELHDADAGEEDADELENPNVGFRSLQ